MDGHHFCDGDDVHVEVPPRIGGGYVRLAGRHRGWRSKTPRHVVPRDIGIAGFDPGGAGNFGLDRRDAELCKVDAGGFDSCP